MVVSDYGVTVAFEIPELEIHLYDVRAIEFCFSWDHDNKTLCQECWLSISFVNNYTQCHYWIWLYTITGILHYTIYSQTFLSLHNFHCMPSHVGLCSIVCEPNTIQSSIILVNKQLAVLPFHPLVATLVGHASTYIPMLQPVAQTVKPLVQITSAVVLKSV